MASNLQSLIFMILVVHMALFFNSTTGEKNPEKKPINTIPIGMCSQHPNCDKDCTDIGYDIGICSDDCAPPSDQCCCYGGDH
ncbi:hypothetical protein ABFX02_14G213100 [Erythranthe guttata]